LIPIRAQPEPVNFSKKVREPGKAFLKKIPHPTTREWKNREYWQRVLPDLYEAYGGFCAYCAEWISRTTCDCQVDHFIPKSIQPELAYEWNNYRLASCRFNRKKGIYQDVLDPFNLEPDWFILEFPSLAVKPNPALSAFQAKQVIATRDHLGLNDEICMVSRLRWIRDFCRRSITFEYLKQNAPFIAYELERQNLVEKITLMMGT